MYFYTRNKFTYSNLMSYLIKMLSNFKNSKLKKICYYLYKTKKILLFLHKDFQICSSCCYKQVYLIKYLNKIFLFVGDIIIQRRVRVAIFHLRDYISLLLFTQLVRSVSNPLLTKLFVIINCYKSR